LKYLYEEIANLGHEITILGGRCRESTIVDDLQLSDRIKTEYIIYPTVKANYLQYPIVLRKYLKERNLSNFDIAISHTEVPFPIDIPIIAKRHDCKAATRSNLPSRSSVTSGVFSKAHSFITKRSVKFADREIFNSELCKRYWTRFYGSSNRNSTVIYNGIDTSKFYPRNGLKPRGREEKYVLHVGGTQRKGLPRILEYADENRYPVYIAGGSDIHHPNVTNVGTISQDTLCQMYSDAIATIHPAYFEAFGNIILESLACGTPVVASDECGAAELLTEETGAVTSDVEKGIEKVTRIHSDNCLTVAQCYPWSDVAKATVDVIHDVLNRS